MRVTDIDVLLNKYFFTARFLVIYVINCYFNEEKNVFNLVIYSYKIFNNINKVKSKFWKKPELLLKIAILCQFSSFLSIKYKTN